MSKRIKLPACYGKFPRKHPDLQAANGCTSCHKLQSCTMKTKITANRATPKEKT